MKERLIVFLAAMFLSLGTAFAQTSINGIVVSSEDGQPVIGASIVVAGTQNGTVTDVDGNFTLSTSVGSKLVVSYVGMNTKTVTAAAHMKITLDPDNKNLDEVVVVAYGTAKRQSITGSVAVVDSKKISDRISTSVTGALEGSAPGVQVNNTYGEPGQAPKIHIRGVGTLVSGADQPLYIVDGTAYSGNIAELNPNDIESVSILKDASSAALYGNRAANGVVLITTKKAKYASKPIITLKVDQGFYRRGIPEYDRLGPDEWMEASWMAYKNYALSNKALRITSEADAAAYATKNLLKKKWNIYDGPEDALFDANGKLIAHMRPEYTDLDWQKPIERTGHRQEYNVSAAVSSDKFNVYSSAGYLNERGYIINSGYERFTGRINTTYNANKWLELGMNLSGTSAIQNYNSNASGSMYGNPFYVTRYMAPIYPYYLHNADGSYVLDADGNPQFDVTSQYLSNRNIAYELRHDNDKNRRNVLDGLIYGKITLPYGFSFLGKVSMKHANSNKQSYDNPNIGDGAGNNGRLKARISQFNSYTGQELLTWEHEFGDHHIDVLLGHENYSWKVRYSSLMNTDAAIDGLLVLNNFVQNATTGGYNEDYRTESYLGRARYNYADKYFVDFSYRRDGSSKFHKDKRWGNFFSFGLNWNIKKEEFMKKVKWVDALRARASYGEVGNDAAVDYYGYQGLYYIKKNAGEPALIRQKLAADNLRWETTQTFDLGVEGTVFNRVNFSIGYFDKRSKDLLFQVRFPLSAGSFYGDALTNLSQYQNIGTISNRGFEFMVNGDVVRSKDWTWNLAFDATTLNNKVIKLPGGKDILHGQQNYSEGHSAYEWYTYHFAGVDQMTGQSLYDIDMDKATSARAAGAVVDINGKEYVTTTTYARRVWAGTALPSVYGSFGSNLRWKDLSLNILMTYSLGGKTMDGPYQSLMSASSATSASALHKDALSSWKGVPAGMTATSPDRIDPNGIPALNYSQSNDNNAVSDRWLTSSSYLVMKNIVLSYRLPKAWVDKCGLGGVSLKAGVENLFTVTSRKGLNPQYSFSGSSNDTYVTARVFNFGVTVNL